MMEQVPVLVPVSVLALLLVLLRLVQIVSLNLSQVPTISDSL